MKGNIAGFEQAAAVDRALFPHSEKLLVRGSPKLYYVLSRVKLYYVFFEKTPGCGYIIKRKEG